MPVKTTLVATLIALQAAPALAQQSQPATSQPTSISAAELQQPHIGDATQAAKAAEAAADAARAAAEAAKSAALAVEALAGHVADLQQTTPVTAPKVPEWAWSLGLSILNSSGNASAFAGQLNAGVVGHWADWGLELKLTSGYGMTNGRNGQPNETTSANAALTARGTHNFTPIFGVYVYGGEATDRVASIESQSFGEAGVSIVWWEIDKDDYVQSKLRTSIGGRGMYETHKQYFGTPATLDPTTIYGPTFSLSGRYALSKMTVITEDADILVDVHTPRDVRFNSATALVVQLTDGFALQSAFTLRYIGAPQPGKETTDTQLSAGINWTW